MLAQDQCTLQRLHELRERERTLQGLLLTVLEEEYEAMALVRIDGWISETVGEVNMELRALRTKVRHIFMKTGLM